MKNIFFFSVATFLSVSILLNAQSYPDNRSGNSNVRTQNQYSIQGDSSSQQQTEIDSSSRSSSPILGNNQMSQKKERTLVILKPDTVRNRHIGDIIKRIEDKGLHIIGMKMLRLNADQAAQFYNMHRGRPFFKDLVQFMSSGPVVVMVLEGENAVLKNRNLMGPTDPSKADHGTIRADFGESLTENAIHGSDNPESAIREIQFFFSADELYGKQN